MAKLNSKEWFVATKHGVILKNVNGWAIMAKTKKEVESEASLQKSKNDIKIKKIELVDILGLAIN